MCCLSDCSLYRLFCTISLTFRLSSVSCDSLVSILQGFESMPPPLIRFPWHQYSYLFHIFPPFPHWILYSFVIFPFSSSFLPAFPPPSFSNSSSVSTDCPPLFPVLFFLHTFLFLIPQSSLLPSFSQQGSVALSCGREDDSWLTGKGEGDVLIKGRQ